ncbi:hypothetical protein AB0G86_36095, partial [Streptomyces scabiei]
CATFCTPYDVKGGVALTSQSGAPPRAHEGNGYGWPLINRLSREVRVVHHAAGGKTITVLVPLT